MGLYGMLSGVVRELRRDADSHVRVRLVIALALVTCSGLLAAGAPLALKAMVDAVAEAKSASNSTYWQVLGFVAVYVLALFGCRLMADLGPLITGYADQRLDRRMTHRFFDHVLALPMEYLLRRHAGELLRSLDLASSACRVVVMQFVNGIVPALIETAAMAVVLMRLDQPALVAVFAATAALYLVVFTLGARRLVPHAGEVSGAHLSLHALLSDHVQHAEALRYFGAEAAASARVDAAAARLEARWRSLHRRRASNALAITALFTISVATSLSLAAQAVAEAKLTVGGFVLASVYMLQLVRPLELLGTAASDIAQSLGFARPMLDILSQPPEPQISAGSPAVAARSAPTGTGPALRFQNVWFGYDPERPVIRGLDLDIPAGATVAVVGASGSGKSSLVRLLLRLCHPRGGRILADGHPIDAWPVDMWRSRIGFVPQDTSLLHDSIAHNIGLGRAGATRDEIAAAARQAQLQGLIDSLPAGLDTPVGERGLRLSGGERQRVAIARALLRRPDLLVLDEGTSMLDQHTEATILQDLDRLFPTCTTLIVTHRHSTLARADLVVVLDRGRVVEQGRLDELRRRAGPYSHLWRQQADAAG